MMLVYLIILKCSISGDNKSFGMPTNPAALDRIAGGSSSGSAVAVAAGFVDFALGEDFTLLL
jgi:amidase